VAAAARHLGITALRKELGRYYSQYDPSQSQAERDKRINGARPLHTAKDLSHSEGRNGRLEVNSVVTLIDTDVYLDNLDDYEGHPIVIVTPHYDKLAGKLTDAFYCYNEDCTVTEVVGDAHGAKYDNKDGSRGQRPFDFTRNDEVCIENKS
jgi:hypothetical protein